MRNTHGLKRGGSPGRPKGKPNRATIEIRESAKKLVEDPAYVASLQKRLKTGKAPHMEQLLHHYAYGKPKERVGIEGAGEGETPLKVVFEEVLKPRLAQDDVRVLPALPGSTGGDA